MFIFEMKVWDLKNIYIDVLFMNYMNVLWYFDNHGVFSPIFKDNFVS